MTCYLYNNQIRLNNKDKTFAKNHLDFREEMVKKKHKNRATQKQSLRGIKK